MKRIVLLFALLMTAITLNAQTNPFPLWADGAPGALGTADKDVPTLTPYLVPAAAGAKPVAAVVICPGGGYGGLAPHEGKDYALFLNELGISAFVLKYRLGSGGYRHPIMLNDAARAVRTVRARATDWNVDPQRIGIMGSSAGGHLASTLLTHFAAGDSSAADPIERVSSRPDLGILCYAVISFGKFTHTGSRDNLLGKNAPEDMIKLLSNELQVTAQTPPTFLWHTVEDKAVPVENSMMFAEALRKNGVPFDLHLYEKGGHGLGLGTRELNPEKRHAWTHDLAFWLQERGFAARK